MKLRSDAISCPRARPGPTSKDCGDLACLNGVRGVEVHWNIGSAREEWHGFGGCVHTGIDDLGTKNSSVHLSGKATNQTLGPNRDRFSLTMHYQIVPSHRFYRVVSNKQRLAVKAVYDCLFD